MQIVIDIPHQIYKASQILDVKYEDVIQIPLECIANGTPLPSHGRLIDADKLKANVGYTGYNYDFQNYIDDAPTIIEADDKESEGMIMKYTLDEAIKHAEEVADEKKKEACNLYDVKNYEESRECIWCSEEHRQLAEWLKDYKRLLEQEPILDKVKAEINGMYRVILKDTPKDDWAVRWNDCLDEVLQIIDKYIKAEGE